MRPAHGRFLLVGAFDPAVDPRRSSASTLAGSDLNRKNVPRDFHRPRRKIRRHVLLRVVKKPPPVRASAIPVSVTCTSKHVVANFLHRLRRARPLDALVVNSSPRIAVIACISALGRPSARMRQLAARDLDRSDLVRLLRLVHVHELGVDHFALSGPVSRLAAPPLCVRRRLRTAAPRRRAPARSAAPCTAPRRSVCEALRQTCSRRRVQLCRGRRRPALAAPLRSPLRPP